MKTFHLNIARDCTLSRSRRQLYYRLMIAYFCFAGILLIQTAYRTSRTITDIRSRRQSLASLRSEFAADRPDAGSVPRYIQELQKTLDTQSEQMEGLITATAPRVPVGELLFRFAGQLPGDMLIRKMSIQPGDKERPVQLTFSLPFEEGREESDPAFWVRKWKADEQISRLIAGLVLADRRDNVMQDDEWVTEFTCTARLKTVFGEGK